MRRASVARYLHVVDGQPAVTQRVLNDVTLDIRSAPPIPQTRVKSRPVITQTDQVDTSPTHEYALGDALQRVHRNRTADTQESGVQIRHARALAATAMSWPSSRGVIAVRHRTPTPTTISESRMVSAAGRALPRGARAAFWRCGPRARRHHC